MRTIRMLIVLLLAAPAAALAHSLAPSLLHAHERGDGLVDLTWTTPALVQAGATVQPRVPESCTPQSAPRIELRSTQYVARWAMRCAPGLTGQRFGAAGLQHTRTSALLRVELADGRRFEKVLTADQPAYAIPERARRFEVAKDYGRIGVQHILGGWDHLAFVLGLMLLVRTRRSLVWTITAFTLGHSVTLALAVIGLVRVPQEWTEAAIALSILVVAVQAARGRERGWLARKPGAGAAGFGLLHGLGFAGALSEVGLPQTEIPLALLSFNLGIELGQLLFVAGMLAAIVLWRQLRRAPAPAWLSHVPSHAIGGLAAFWLFQRFAAAWA